MKGIKANQQNKGHRNHSQKQTSQNRGPRSPAQAEQHFSLICSQIFDLNTDPATDYQHDPEKASYFHLSRYVLTMQ